MTKSHWAFVLILAAIAGLLFNSSAGQQTPFSPPTAFSTGVNVIDSLSAKGLSLEYFKWVKTPANADKKIVGFYPVASTLVYDTAFGGTTSSVRFQAFILYVNK